VESEEIMILKYSDWSKEDANHMHNILKSVLSEYPKSQTTVTQVCTN